MTGTSARGPDRTGVVSLSTLSLRNQCYHRVLDGGESLRLCYKVCEKEGTLSLQKSTTVFDFDGVLSSGLEDQLYRIEEIAGEADRLNEISEILGFSSKLYGDDPRYLRHLVFQEAANRIDLEIEAGPFLEKAKQMAELDQPFFVLTARSGVAAVARMMKFLRSHDLFPQEIFCVGRTPKTQQLKYVAGRLSVAAVTFIDDSSRHIQYADLTRSKGARIYTKHVERAKQYDKSFIEQYFWMTVIEALSRCGAEGEAESAKQYLREAA